MHAQASSRRGGVQKKKGRVLRERRGGGEGGVYRSDPPLLPAYIRRLLRSITSLNCENTLKLDAVMAKYFNQGRSQVVCWGGGGGGGGGEDAKHVISGLNQWCRQDDTCSNACV